MADTMIPVNNLPQLVTSAGLLPNLPLPPYVPDRPFIMAPVMPLPTVGNQTQTSPF